VRAIIESNWLSWARTGATGAVAARRLARPDARILGLIGAGRQARAALELMAAARPLDAVYVFSRDPGHRRDFAAAMRASTGLPVDALDSADEVVGRSDIVVTTTTAHAPVFTAAALHPGLHINAIGAHYPDRREIDGPTVARSRLFADDPARSRLEDGEVALAVEEGQLRPDPPLVGLAEVVSGTDPGRRSDEEVTLFLSGGSAGEYLAVAAAAVDGAERLGLGTRIEL
jgi:ornithine cyclodeaminase/alanine dehydrogenase